LGKSVTVTVLAYVVSALFPIHFCVENPATPCSLKKMILSEDQQIIFFFRREKKQQKKTLNFLKKKA